MLTRDFHVMAGAGCSRWISSEIEDYFRGKLVPQYVGVLQYRIRIVHLRMLVLNAEVRVEKFMNVVIVYSLLLFFVVARYFRMVIIEDFR